MLGSARSLLVLLALVLGFGAVSQWLGARHRAAIGADVARLASAGDLKMLSSDTCTVCAAARQWFQANAVPFEECSIERDAACAAQFDATRSPGTPVILVRGIPQVGFAPERLRAALSQRS